VLENFEVNLFILSASSNMRSHSL